MTNLADIVGGLVEVVKSDELHRRGEIDKNEIDTPQFKGRTIMIFTTLQYANHFGTKFALEYLIPKYGMPEAAKFPMTKVTNKVIRS